MHYLCNGFLHSISHLCGVGANICSLTRALDLASLLFLSLILQKTFSIYLNIDHIRRLIYFHLNVNHLRFPCNREMYSIFIRNVMNVFRFRFLPLPLPLHCIRISIQQNIHFYSILKVFFFY